MAKRVFGKVGKSKLYSGTKYKPDHVQSTINHYLGSGNATRAHVRSSKTPGHARNKHPQYGRF